MFRCILSLNHLMQKIPNHQLHWHKNYLFEWLRYYQYDHVDKILWHNKPFKYKGIPSKKQSKPKSDGINIDLIKEILVFIF